MKLLPVMLGILVSCTLHGAAIGQTVQDQLLSQTPSTLARLAKQFPDQPVTVDFQKADLDRSGHFQYVVAAYAQATNPGLYLRIFRQTNSGLVFLGEQEDSETHGGLGWHLTLVDIDGDGIPEFDLSGTDASGQQVMHEYFRWTGTSVHELLDPTEEMANDAALEDIDGSGRLSLVVRHGASYVIYQFNGSDFAASKTVANDPLGLIGPDGSLHKARALFCAIRPAGFSLEEVNRDKKRVGGRHDRPDEDGKIQLVMGQLRDLKGAPVSVDQVDVETVILSRGLQPSGFRIRPGRDDETNSKEAHSPVLELEFSRNDLLKLLPKLKLDGPLIAGDKIELLAYGMLKDGTRVSAATFVLIRENERRDHRGDDN